MVSFGHYQTMVAPHARYFIWDSETRRYRSVTLETRLAHGGGFAPARGSLEMLGHLVDIAVAWPSGHVASGVGLILLLASIRAIALIP